VCAPAPGLATRTAAASPSAKTTRPRATDRIAGCTWPGGLSDCEGTSDRALNVLA
jgi:hypothetical protein